MCSKDQVSNQGRYLPGGSTIAGTQSSLKRMALSTVGEMPVSGCKRGGWNPIAKWTGKEELFSLFLAKLATTALGAATIMAIRVRSADSIVLIGFPW
jgi:hypothetical protein